MRYCESCGTPHECEAQAAAAAVDREVEIARINAKRDVDVARISANLQRDELETAEAIAEVEADAEVVAAVAATEGMADAIDAMTPDPPAPDPIVVDAPPATEEPPSTDVPPVVEHEAADSKPKTRGLGMWG